MTPSWYRLVLAACLFTPIAAQSTSAAAGAPTQALAPVPAPEQGSAEVAAAKYPLPAQYVSPEPADPVTCSMDFIGIPPPEAAAPAPAPAVAPAALASKGAPRQSVARAAAGRRLLQDSATSLNYATSALNAVASNAQGRALLSANISCSGGQPLSITGGSALRPFVAGFQGVNFVLDVSLPQGAMTLSNQNVVIQNSQFINLSFFASAVFILQNSNVVFKNATFTGCQNAVAAAIFGNNSQVTVANSNFISNFGRQTGVIQMMGNSSQLSVSNSLFYNNTGAQGGAIAMLTTESLSLINSNISYCKAQNGGGVFVQNTTLAYYLNNTVNYNTADNNGGGFFGERTPAIYARNDYYANQAGHGGSIWQNAAQNVTFYNNVISNGLAVNGSGGLEMLSTNLTAFDSNTFINNLGTQGAGMYWGQGTGSVTNCFFIANNATAFGGGMFIDTCVMNIVNTTVEANYANTTGGGIYMQLSTNNIATSSFINNIAKFAAGLFRNGCLGLVSTNNSLAASACNEYSPPPGAATNGIQCSASFENSCSNYASSSITTGVVRQSSNTNACGVGSPGVTVGSSTTSSSSSSNTGSVTGLTRSTPASPSTSSSSPSSSSTSPTTSGSSGSSGVSGSSGSSGSSSSGGGLTINSGS